MLRKVELEQQRQVTQLQKLVPAAAKQAQGATPPTKGAKPPTKGAKPLTKGARPPTKGAKPPTKKKEESGEVEDEATKTAREVSNTLEEVKLQVKRRQEALKQQEQELAKREKANEKANALHAEKGAAERAATEMAKPGKAKAKAKATPQPEPALASTLSADQGAGQVGVRFNHSHEKFDVVDGKLDFEAVDEKYCLSFVFRGDWMAKLRGDEGETIAPDGGALTRVTVGSDGVSEAGDEKQNVVGSFSGLTIGSDYTLEVEEDPEALAAREEEAAAIRALL